MSWTETVRLGLTKEPPPCRTRWLAGVGLGECVSKTVAVRVHRGPDCGHAGTRDQDSDRHTDDPRSACR